jgi:hypothetical protein
MSGNVEHELMNVEHVDEMKWWGTRDNNRGSEKHEMTRGENEMMREEQEMTRKKWDDKEHEMTWGTRDDEEEMKNTRWRERNMRRRGRNEEHEMTRRNMRRRGGNEKHEMTRGTWDDENECHLSSYLHWPFVNLLALTPGLAGRILSLMWCY